MSSLRLVAACPSNQLVINNRSDTGDRFPTKVARPQLRELDDVHRGLPATVHAPRLESPAAELISSLEVILIDLDNCKYLPLLDTDSIFDHQLT